MPIILFLVALIVVLVFIPVPSNPDHISCSSKGGIYLISRSGDAVCIAKSATIDLDTK